jgi:hypothetical protein
MLRLHLLALLALVASCAFGLASAQAWDDGDAQIAVRLSWAAYCPVTQVNAWTCYWCTHAGTPRLTVMGTTVDGPTKYVMEAGIGPEKVRPNFRIHLLSHGAYRGLVRNFLGSITSSETF